ncbi:MAG: FAD-dependent tricarballylate dehydrogenase TcuA [Dehalococcoidia bacterium]|jgi:tricarballylate dehydrogenase|uniref:FAD-dependent tricarballylate dehydrogenase TcuA n=1 Tax=Candidatus Amarobacter glycogenicus TaxID=3140699 RepID=UPI0031355782|nr:FAD-dependent tricarballylate dehydrogenase TcuA [Dehalococcoidia bacterium]MBK6563072.1 FAD-dependent tricarballylate dehydrogenase TcuA [Dehalococcoidia bacterium]MBK7126720.1 FAD-dependent tricarballylate dehydrogenase TcuA [Dehalococcoidia bacterium]MBK7329654.1 FAD-dependent tricarballylate dehydrogenase TcuA [Dehalococcoidia bacterium]MBK8561579.1 FAD-dependent tricarballylate dehydrogenase TcuA [Dehalococcoidia bacterium]
MPIPSGSGGAAATYETGVLVVGGGIAGLSTAISARQSGAETILIEKAPIEGRGGNTRFADAQMRFPHEADEFGPRDYSVDDMFEDLMRISRGRANPDLIRTLCENARQTAEWLTGMGLEWEKGYPHTAGYRRSPSSGGQGLVDLLYRRLEGLGGAVAYLTGAIDLIVRTDGSVAGVRARGPEGITDIYASGGVVLACGGFQANVEMRVRYLGRFADSLILRGSRYNTGEGLRMAIDAGAQPAGQWGDYHSAVLDARSPKIECGVTALYNYQMGIFVDRQGRRFLDEGEDFRDHTYVKFSKFIVEQAGGEAWCLFDQKAYQREEFARAWRPVGPPVEANTLKELADGMELPAENLMDTVANFNAAIQPGEYDLDRLDGKRTLGITPPKSNWALPLDSPPYLAIPVTGGITFTFGGIRCDTSARVIDTRGQVMEGLYAAGEPMGEIFYYNYPGASSVIRGAVFGKIAGAHAAARSPA